MNRGRNTDHVVRTCEGIVYSLLVKITSQWVRHSRSHPKSIRCPHFHGNVDSLTGRESLSLKLMHVTVLMNNFKKPPLKSGGYFFILHIFLPEILPIVPYLSLSLSLSLSRSLALSLALAPSPESDQKKFFFFHFFFYWSNFFCLFFVSSSSTLLSILRMFGMKQKPITRTKEEILQNCHLRRFSTELFN